MSGEGTRVVVEDGTGTAAAKLRVRRSSLKVYDDRFVPLGELRGSEGTAAASRGDGGAARGSPRVYRYDDNSRAAFERRRAGVWELADRLRVERTGRGWAVFDADADWLGRFEEGERDRWQLVHGRAPEVTSRLRSEDGAWIVERDGKEVLRTRLPEDVPPALLLAMELEAISVLDRAAVGLWLGPPTDRRDRSGRESAN